MSEKDKESRELLAAIAHFDKMGGEEPVARLANAIEDVIDARVAARLSVPKDPPEGEPQ